MSDETDDGPKTARSGERAAPADIPRRVLDNLLEGCQVIGPDFRYLYVNEAVVRHGRKPREELIGRTMPEVYPGIEDTEMFSVLRRCLDRGEPQAMDNAFTFADGSTRWFELRFEPLPEGAVILSLDITDRKAMETRLGRANRALTALSECNQTLVRATDERRFMQDVCRLVVDKGGYRLAWLGLKDARGGAALVPAAHAKAGGGAIDQLQAAWDEGERGAGPIGRAIRGGRTVVVSSIADDPGSAPWRAAALERGLRSCIALPIRDDGGVLGALAIYAAEGDAFDAVERGLLEELTLDLGYGITTLRARARLRSTDERLAAIAQAAPAAIFSLDPEGRVLTWNRGAERIFGWTAREAVGRPAPMVPADKQAEFAALRRRVLAGESFTGVEAERVRKDGSSVWIDISTAPLRDAGGDISGIMAVVLDATERLQIERALKDSEQRYRELVANLEDVVFSMDPDGRITFMSPAIERIYGYRPDAVIGMHYSEFVHPDDRQRLAASLARTLAGHAAPIEFRGLDVHGRTHHLRSKSRIRRAQGRPVGIDGVLVDLTEQRRTEEQLELAQRLEAIGRLAGGVAHDFNNLLSVIISYADFALDELRESDPIHQDIAEIHRAGQRAAALTRQLLAFSRKQILEPEVLELNAVITGIESMLRRLLGEDIEIAVHLDQALGRVEADPAQLEQVIMNLAVNARDAMPRGGKLSIETANVELDEDYSEQHVAVRPGRYCMLAVSDSGTGMDAGTRAHIFEPFFTTKTKGKGTGLGLATVYGIVKQSGGNIWVYSEPDQGTTFKIYLPQVDAPASATRHSPEPVAATGAETVLIVEDEDAVRRLAERILRAAGYRTLTAASGGDAVVLCERRAGEIDLLLTDVVMPQMSGRELAERLLAANPGLQVLYTSGYTDDAIVQHGVLESGTHFIAKPFTAAGLTRKVRLVLDQARPATGDHRGPAGA